MMQSPTHAVGQKVSVVIWVNKNQREQILRKSGVDNDFSRDFLEKGEETHGAEEFGYVPLPYDQDRESALRTASCYGDACFGVVPCRKGFALRVQQAKKAAILANVHGSNAAKFTGKKWEVRGVPSFWGSGEVKEFLKAWGGRTPFFQKERDA